MWHQNIIDTIGNTPLVQLNRLTKDVPCTVLVKLELFNPGGSVKDRIGYAMVQAAEESGQLKPGGIIVEATSGNTGTGIVQAARLKGEAGSSYSLWGGAGIMSNGRHSRRSTLIL